MPISDIEFDKRLRLALSGVALIAVTVLLYTGQLAEHGGYELFAYIVGYIIGGQFGPSIKFGSRPSKSSVVDDQAEADGKEIGS